jgi:hydrogenase small subunit
MTRRDDGLYAAMVHRGMSRRTFLKFSAAMATTLALPLSYAPRIAAAVTAAPRIPVIWLRGQACGGNTRAFLQASKPTTAELLLDRLSVQYHETIMARSGTSAEAARRLLVDASPNGYLAVIEGAIPVGDEGVYCTVGGRVFSDVVREVCGGAMATIALGSCAFDGGLSAAAGGTTGSVGADHVVPAATLINLPGCPVNVENLTATIVHYLTFGTLPATDARNRPLFAYGGLLHNQCERRAHFEFGEYVGAWGDEGSQKGWCLYKMGCKGPETFANCPTARYANGTSWPVKAGHGCIGCTTAGFWDQMSPVYARLPGPLPFVPQVTADMAGVALVGGVAALTVAHGAASAVRLHRWGVEERRASGPAHGGIGEAEVKGAGAAEVKGAGAAEVEGAGEAEVEGAGADEVEVIDEVAVSDGADEAATGDIVETADETELADEAEAGNTEPKADAR